MQFSSQVAQTNHGGRITDGKDRLAIDTIVKSVRKTNYLVVVDQSWSFGSPGSEIASQVHQHCFDDLDNAVVRVHSADVPTPYAVELEQAYLPNAQRICEAVRSVTYNA